MLRSASPAGLVLCPTPGLLGPSCAPELLPTGSLRIPHELHSSTWELITRYSLPLGGRSWLSPAPSLGFLRHTPGPWCSENPFRKGKISSFPSLLNDSPAPLPFSAERFPPVAEQAVTCFVPHCAHSGNADAETCSCLKFVPNQNTLFGVTYNETQIPQVGNRTQPRNLFTPKPHLMPLLSASWEPGLCRTPPARKAKTPLLLSASRCLCRGQQGPWHCSRH